MAFNQETILRDDAFLVSETDSKGIILFANDEFCNTAEYDIDDFVGANHNIVRHKDMPKVAFKDLWDTVRNGKTWQGYVKNGTKSGGYYWVFATVYPFRNEKNEQCYLSCRRKPSREDVEKYNELSKTLH
jgi:PAS domain S-box-containing protein